MPSLSAPSFPSLGWSLEDMIIMSNEYSNNASASIRSESLEESQHPTYSCFSQPKLSPGNSLRSSDSDPTVLMVKKISHNANERDRRKKISSLYSSLRSLLPPSDQTKKLSIPATVSHVVKYIPELQKELEKMNQKKKELLSVIIARKQELMHHENLTNGSSLTSISASSLGNKEVLVQLSTSKFNNISLSKVLQKLEEDGLHVLDASSFQSFGDKIIYSLHLQVHGTLQYELEILPQRLLNHCMRS